MKLQRWWILCDLTMLLAFVAAWIIVIIIFL